jgi:uncharacterized membrane protein
MSKKLRTRPAQNNAVSNPNLPRPDTSPISQIAPSASASKRITSVMQKSSSFEGSIPHPDIFKLYGEVVPDAPERILKVFEEDSLHARKIQSDALNAQKRDNRRVHWMAWSLIFGGYLLSGAFAYMGKDWLAAIILGTTLAGTIAGFFQSRKEAKE